MEVLLSPHATKVMADRGVDYAEVRLAVTRPEVTWTGDRTKYPDGYTVSQRGEIAVVTKLRGWRGDVEVVTVLWRTNYQWTDDQMKEGRK